MFRFEICIVPVADAVDKIVDNVHNVLALAIDLW